ncbi:MAG: valine--tRNA ligase [Rickettsiales bacterium]|nr:valine--tRNA ligase [Rickettsiales bacterium]
MLDKRFNFSEIEKQCLRTWVKNKTYRFKEENNKEAFCIMMPPPNVTGSLHIGHALTFTLQDVLIRFQKKLNKNVLWQPGTDHAGIATEIVVERMLLEKNKNKNDLGRDNFIKEIWSWKKKSGDQIVNQMVRLGTSVDWSISRFTMDDGLSNSVNEVFIKLFNKGLIYKNKRLVNWDPELKTAVSDLEVNQIESNGNMWYIKYDLDNSHNQITVGTTRPETIFGDSAIAIHPKNKKLKKFIGKFARVPIINRKIPIIADTYADPKKGSGAVKITPAHDFNDFEIGKKHKLGLINIFDESANLCENIPLSYKGLNRFKARKKVVLELNKINKIEKILKNKMVIPYGDRSGQIIEPFLTDQWFLDTKKICIKVKKELQTKKIRFHPNSWINTFTHWIDNIEPWCISRQIWWGHRIPIWYTDCEIIIAAKTKKEANEILKTKNRNAKITYQEQDVLDTWFSSALWPFTTLGWPKNTKLLKKYYPTDVLVTGFDIIFFWVARMIMMGLEFTKEVPFKNIYIHPLVKDENGKKMSKSKGNVIDPLELINLYGSDALRFTLANLSTQGRDIKLSNKLVENSRNFITKIWNVARFSQFNNFKYNKNYKLDSCDLSINNWILYKFFETKKKVLKNIELFKFNLVISELYQFIWNDFCDLYIELSKNYLNDKSKKKEIEGVFSFVFSQSLNLINPVIPFITEKIGKELGYIKNSYYSQLIDSEKFNYFKKKNVSDFNYFIELVKKIRFELSQNSSKSLKLFIISEKKINWIEQNLFLLNSIFNFNSVNYLKKDNSKKKNNYC